MQTTSASGLRILIISVFCTFSAAASPPAVLLDSLSGAAEVRRAGTTQWKKANAEEQLYNNDVIRIAPGGLGKLTWPDNSAAYMRGGSQILVNIGPPSAQKKLLNYATVFIGSVFFVIKKTLPADRREDIQLYTPTTVLTIRGTSFEIGVTPESGTTSVKVVCGTVRVRCIKKNVSSYLNAPFKTVIDKETDPIVSTALLSTDIDSLRQWVPDAVIEAEVAAHLSQGKRDRLIISGRLEEKCVIMPFTINTKQRGEWNLRTALPKLLAERLTSADKQLTMLIADSAAVSADEAAAKAQTRFVIMGTVTFLDIVNHAEITVRADEYRERSIGRITFDLVLYDAKEKIDRSQTTVMGESTGKKNTENSWAAIGAMPFDLNNEQFAHSLIGTALDQALDAAQEKLLKALYE